VSQKQPEGSKAAEARATKEAKAQALVEKGEAGKEVAKAAKATAIAECAKSTLAATHVRGKRHTQALAAAGSEVAQGAATVVQGNARSRRSTRSVTTSWRANARSARTAAASTRSQLPR
jgi:hypothetical protein